MLLYDVVDNKKLGESEKAVNFWSTAVFVTVEDSRKTTLLEVKRITKAYEIQVGPFSLIV